MRDADGNLPFFPEYETKQQARKAILKVLRDEEARANQDRARWSLTTLREECSWLDVETDAGMWQILDRLDISYHRGRRFVESPDEDFEAKCDYIDRVTESADDKSDQAVLYLDELQYYRVPDIERAWEAEGTRRTVSQPPISKYGWSRHIVAAIDRQQGDLLWQHVETVDTDLLVNFYHQIASQYQGLNRIWLVQDNLALHFHPKVLRQLESQLWNWNFFSPPNWPDPAEAANRDGPLPIQLVPFPYYASWLNPVELFWRNLKRQVLYLQPDGCHPAELVDRVNQYLHDRQDQPARVLQEIGLSNG